MSNWAVLFAVAVYGAVLDTRPPVSEAERLPSIDYLNECYCLAYSEWQMYDMLAKQLWKDFPYSSSWRQAESACAESDRIFQWYNLARLAREPAYPERHRRDWLQQLRDLSPETYYSGNWPPPVPWWRLRQTK